MNPIRAAVERPYTVAVAVLLTVLFSWLAFRTIPVQLKPTVDKPMITVTTSFRGASAVEVEEQLTRELEDVLQEVEGLEEMSSTSSEGLSAINLEYGFGADMQLAVVDVINKLSRVPALPDEADEPLIEIGASNQQQVMWLAIHSRYDVNHVRRIVEDEVESRLKRVEGVSNLLVVGGSENEIQVRVDPDRLVGFGVSIADLSDALFRGNVNVRGGTVESGTRQMVVRTVGRAAVPERLEDIIVKESEGGSVRLGDVAQVFDTHRESRDFVKISGVSGVCIGVGKKAGANVVKVIHELEASCGRMNEMFVDRGLDLRLVPVYRETTYIDAAMSFVSDNLFLGAAFAVLVLVLFLRSLRSVLVVSLSIPISLVAVFLVMKSMGRTLNIISLAGIAFASGMVVDNAIVVLENIFRHREMGKSALEAAIEGGREVWGGVLASTLTTVAVFIPVLLQGDEASMLFSDIALAISAAVLISLAVSLTVVPVLTALVFRRDAPRTDASDRTPLGPLGRAYAATIARIASSRALGAKLGFVLLLVAVSMSTVRLTPPAEYLPAGNMNFVIFFAAPIPGTRPEQVRDNFAPLEQWALSQPEVDRMFTVASPFFNGGGIVLKDEFNHAEGIAEFYGRVWGPCMTLAGFQYVVPIRMSLFEESSKQFEIELSGPDFATLERASGELQNRLMQVSGVLAPVRSSLVTGRPELQVTVDEDRAKDMGLSVDVVGAVVETAVAGRRMSAMIEGGREVDVNVLVPPERIDSPEKLAALRFIAPGGKLVSLGSVASIERTIGPESIRHLERERNVLLTVNIAEDAPLETVVQRIEEDVFPALAADLGPAYTLTVGGSADKLKTTLESLSGGFGLSVLIVYLLLVALFRSWVSPLVILTTVPLALSGGLIGIRVAHSLSGGQAAFDVLSMLGFVILTGLVVNNAILIVHQANNFRAEGLDARRALAESARTRLRPILMSVITTVSAMIPLALGGGAGAELYQGLGAVIVGGLLVSTLFTLVLVPVLLSIGYDLAELMGSRRVAAPAVTGLVE